VEGRRHRGATSVKVPRVRTPETGGAAGGSPSAAPLAAALELEAVSVEYPGTRALRAVRLAIGPGERVAVIGPSGAGKSTLLRLANTSLLPSSGALRVLGEDPAAISATRLRALRARIGTIWQQLHLVPQASVLENVRMGRVGSSSLAVLALGGASAAERARVGAVLARVGIEDKLDQRLETLSGGEQQRVAVARVLHQGPDLLLADEPLASVDPARAAEVMQLLLAAAEDRTLVVSTHLLEPVLPFFPRVIGLRGGEVIFDLPRERVTAADLARLYQPVAATPSGERIEAPAPPLPPAPPADAPPLRVAASSLPGDHLLPRVLPALRAAHPEIRVRLAVSDTGAALGALLGGDADLALVGARELHPDLLFEDVLEDEIVLLASPALDALYRPGGGPLALSVLARLPRVDREPGSATRQVVEAQLAGMGAPLDPAAQIAETGSPAALLGAIAAGVGVGFASRLSAAGPLAAGRVRAVPVERLRIPRRVYAAVRRGGSLPVAARALLELVRAEAARIGSPPA
jgi:phosphonate transport system ATP-binding protein